MKKSSDFECPETLRRRASRRALLVMPPLVAVAAAAIPAPGHAEPRVAECLADTLMES